MFFRTVDGTVKNCEDYVAKTETITLPPGESTKTITIELKWDYRTKANETYHVDLYGLSSNALFTKNRGFGTVLNDDELQNQCRRGPGHPLSYGSGLVHAR